MKTSDPYISDESEYYVYAPSILAKETYYYVICTGHYLYKPGYFLERDSYDSYLLLYVEEGSLLVDVDGQRRKADEGSFVLLNCYEPHAYGTENGCRCLWCHIDGRGAAGYYRAVTGRLGNLFSIRNAFPVVFKMKEIFEMFAPGEVIKEPLVSKYLTDIFTAFLLSVPKNQAIGRKVSEETVSYINGHFKEEITTELLAEKVGLSPFHFIRTFKKETGFTPHEYLVRTRIDMAKYLLKNTQMSVKDICFATGFSSESVFCSAFKKSVGMSPNLYRKHE